MLTVDLQKKKIEMKIIKYAKTMRDKLNPFSCFHCLIALSRDLVLGAEYHTCCCPGS